MTLINPNDINSIPKFQVWLGNVDNTSDANKPVSTAQQAALDLKADKDWETITNASVNGVTLSSTWSPSNFLKEDWTYWSAWWTPTTTKWDMIVHNWTTDVRLPVWPNWQVLRADSTAPEWVVWQDLSWTQDRVLWNLIDTSYKIPLNYINGTTSTINRIINRLYYFPFHLTASKTINELWVYVWNFPMNNWCRMGIYTNSSNRPWTLVVQTSDVTGTWYISDSTLSEDLEPWLYWWAFVAWDSNSYIKTITPAYTKSISLSQAVTTVFNNHYYESLGSLVMPTTPWTLTNWTWAIMILFTK